MYARSTSAQRQIPARWKADDDSDESQTDCQCHQHSPSRAHQYHWFHVATISLRPNDSRSPAAVLRRLQRPSGAARR